MKKKIAILGSTGSIGKALIDILKKDKENFNIVLLTTNKNFRILMDQAKIFKVKNLIILDKSKYLQAIRLNKNKNIKIFNNFDCFKKIFKKKIDYTMNSITGLDGLLPTINVIKYTKIIAIANKEAIICGWDLINKELNLFKTKFIPVDSEHFSIWYALRNNSDPIEKIILTASGGPFYKTALKKFKNIKLKDALKHPNWKMGKKITIDSATMMNKVFEVIEAKNIFNIGFNKIEILNHQKSYVHALVQFKNGMSKIITHDTNMKIPISNTLYNGLPPKTKSSNLKIKILNNLSLHKIDVKKFPLVKILKTLPNKHSLFETILVSANDTYVNQFINGKIEFVDISKKVLKILNLKESIKYKNIPPKKIQDILNLDKLVRLKIKTKSV